jgi:hypothetical protein
MKPLLLLLTLFAGLSSPAFAGGIPAKDALRTLARERGASWLDRIVQMGGDQGSDQPAAWHIVAKTEGGGLQEFFVGKKGVISEGPVPAPAAGSLAGPTIPQKKWTFDSTIAFTRAETAAKNVQLGYFSANFRLRSPQASAAPVWSLQLNNATGQKVADVTVSASTGKVLNFTTYSAPPPPPPAPPPQSNSQPALDRTREVLNRGAQGLGRGLNKAGGWLRKTFSPNASPSPSPAPETAPAPYYYGSPRGVAQ